MGLSRWVTRLVSVPGEPAVDQMRKEFVVTCYGLVGLLLLLWLTASFAKVFTESGADGFRAVCQTIANLLSGTALTSATVYVIATKKISRHLCEYPAICAALTTVISDMGGLATGVHTIVYYNVLVLDSLLVCRASDAAARFVVCVTTLWIVVRAFLEAEGVGGDDCSESYTRFSMDHLYAVAEGLSGSLVVLLIDFAATRGFAKSMHEQKAMVEASIQLSEAAAVLLSKYETEDTKTLLEGPDGERLPAGLRQALLQLVQNLALYRPYLPQSCMPSSDRGGSDDPASVVFSDDDLEVGLEREATTAVSVGSAENVVASSSELSSRADSDPCLGSSRLSVVRGPVPAEARNRRVSAVAVNSKFFLRVVESISATRAFIAAEVGAFVGSVAAERGVVDLVSGDHMYGNFNASRMCTTHKLGAARVAWGATQVVAIGSSVRTACACSGPVLCGDFGTADTRRFMLLGPMFNTMQCLERVAAQLSMVLVDDVVGADADVGSNFFFALVEQLHYAKRGPKPFFVWRMAGMRELNDDVAEWMYELARQAPSPHESWNTRLAEWLGGGRPFEPGQLDGAPFPCNVAALTGAREQSQLTEATVTGDTVAFDTSLDAVALQSVL